MWELNSERRNEKPDLSIWARVRVIVADSKAAKVTRIPYFGGGCDFDEAQLGIVIR